MVSALVTFQEYNSFTFSSSAININLLTLFVETLKTNQHYSMY